MADDYGERERTGSKIIWTCHMLHKKVIREILTTCGDEGGFEVCVGLAVVGLTVVGLTVVGLTLGDVDGDFVGEVVGTQSEPQKGPCISIWGSSWYSHPEFTKTSVES